jgi:hypothetical protein
MWEMVGANLIVSEIKARVWLKLLHDTKEREIERKS